MTAMSGSALTISAVTIDGWLGHSEISLFGDFSGTGHFTSWITLLKHNQ